MKRIYLLSLLSFLATISFGQVTANFTNWKDNVTAAYTLTHDDFGLGNVNGIEDYADTITHNRGLKMAFGAVPAQCDANDWIVAKRLLSHGHEIMNHTWNHKCGNPNAEAWCLAFGVWDEDDYDIEIVAAHDEIKSGSGAAPRFFIYPFDQFTASSDNYLVNTMNYIGTRTGPYDNGLNYANISNPTHPGFYITRPPNGENYITTSEFNKIITSINTVVNQGAWGFREFHGVQDGSWGTLTANQYREMCDLLKSKVEAGDLWVGTPSEVISYVKQRQLYTPTANYNSTTKKISVSFNTPSFDFQKYLDNRVFTSPVTLHINTSNHPGDYIVVQNGVEITDFKKIGNDYYINIYPIDGDIELSNYCELCLTKQPSGKTVTEGEPVTFSVEATSDNTITYQWYKDGNIINGATSNTYSIGSTTTNDDGNYYAKLSSNNTIVTSSTAKLRVFQSTNCGEPICLTFQTTSTSVEENSNFTARVEAEGNDLTFDWYKNDIKINHSGPTYDINNINFLSTATFKVKISDGLNTKWTEPFKISVFNSSTQSPYNSAPFTIPGSIEAEEFDNGGQGIAYNDNNAGSQTSNALRTSEDVEVESFTWQQYSIGYTEVGEWLDYSVDIDYVGTYNISIRNASANPYGEISLYLDDSMIVEKATLPNTGGWYQFTNTDLGTVSLNSGRYTLRLFMNGYDSNIDKITFEADNLTDTETIKEKNNVFVSPNPVHNQFRIISNLNGKVNLNMTNTSGQIVYEGEHNTNTNINIESLPSGVYIVNITDKNESSTYRIIKK